MAANLVKENIYSVGTLDWNRINFHGSTYTTRRGVTYNSYLILDEKPTLIDTVDKEFSKELLDNIKSIIDPAKIEIIIINHIEPDHSGAFPEIIKACPNAKVYGTEKAKQGLLKYYGVCGDWTSVKTGESINIGKRKLDFIDVPMIHWPDSMFTYSSFDKILFSNDGFGQHYTTNKIFDDEVDYSILMEEAKKYYANILWPFGGLLSAKLAAIQKMNLDIELILPSHGLIWRKYIKDIMEKYLFWSGNGCENKVAIVFETMWNSTDIMARKILEGISSEGLDAKIFDISKSDRTEVAAYMLDAKGFVFGSSTQGNDMLPVISGFLNVLKGFKPKNRKAFCFGSYGWGGGAVVNMEKVLKEIGNITIEPNVQVQYMPAQEELDKCFLAGKDFAKKIKEGN